MEELLPAGKVLEAKLLEKGWNQTDLAHIIGRPGSVVNDIIQGKSNITHDTAIQLGAAFGTSAEYWLNLQAIYKAAGAGESEISRRAKIFEQYPVREMARRGWISQIKDIEVLEQELGRFASGSFRYAARQSASAAKDTLRRAWFFRVFNLAKTMPVEKYSELKMVSALKELKTWLPNPTAIQNIPELMRLTGIRFLVVEQLPGSELDGVCCWLDEKSPVVGLTLRHDQLDRFWFTLLHELEHVRHRHGVREAIIDANLLENTTAVSEEEAIANRGAGESLIPERELSSFIARVQPIFNSTQITGFARRIGVHPSIVVGQLQHRGLIGWNQHTKMHVKVRSILTTTATYEGWGMQINLGGHS